MMADSNEVIIFVLKDGSFLADFKRMPEQQLRLAEVIIRTENTLRDQNHVGTERLNSYEVMKSNSGFEIREPRSTGGTLRAIGRLHAFGNVYGSVFLKKDRGRTRFNEASERTQFDLNFTEDQAAFRKQVSPVRISVETHEGKRIAHAAEISWQGIQLERINFLAARPSQAPRTERSNPAQAPKERVRARPSEVETFSPRQAPERRVVIPDVPELAFEWRSDVAVLVNGPLRELWALEAKIEKLESSIKRAGDAIEAIFADPVPTLGSDVVARRKPMCDAEVKRWHRLGADRNKKIDELGGCLVEQHKKTAHLISEVGKLKDLAALEAGFGEAAPRLGRLRRRAIAKSSQSVDGDEARFWGFDAHARMEVPFEGPLMGEPQPDNKQWISMVTATMQLQERAGIRPGTGMLPDTIKLGVYGAPTGVELSHAGITI